MANAPSFGLGSAGGKPKEQAAREVRIPTKELEEYADAIADQARQWVWYKLTEQGLKDLARNDPDFANVQQALERFTDQAFTEPDFKELLNRELQGSDKQFVPEVMATARQEPKVEFTSSGGAPVEQGILAASEVKG
jgi:hypothetical protein